MPETVKEKWPRGTPFRVARPGEVKFLVNKEDADRSAQYNGTVPVWCDGSIRGNEPHPREDYEQVMQSLYKRQNSCPTCGRYGTANSIGVKRPDLLPRLVNAKDSSVAARTNTRIEVRCNGVMQGQPEHPEEQYSQPAIQLVDGVNSCPACGKQGSQRSIAKQHPTLVKRLVNPSDARRASKTDTKILVWCDGEVQGGEPHPREEYDQPVRSFTGKQNGCTWCGPRGAANSLAAKHPELMHRLVDQNDGAVKSRAQVEIGLWCDGETQGMKAHPREQYRQLAASFVDGYNGCPECGTKGGLAYSIGAKCPDLIDRLVNKEDAKIAASTEHLVTLWCDGTVQGESEHPRIEYEQTAVRLTARSNRCPICGPFGSAHSIAAVVPEMLPRLVNAGDASVAAKSRNRVLLWCDGEVQGKEAHPREEYEQIAASMTLGNNGCPACGKANGSRYRLIALLASFIGCIESASPAVITRLVAHSNVALTRDAKNALYSGDKAELLEAIDALKARTGSGEDDDLIDDADVVSVDETLIASATDDSADQTDGQHSASSGKPTLKDAIPRRSAAQLLDDIDATVKLAGGDESLVEFIINDKVNQAWLSAYGTGPDQYASDMRAVLPDGEYAREVRSRWLDQYDSAQALPIPDGWAFRPPTAEPGTPAVAPNLMQRHIAALLGQRRNIGNWSQTGTGKTVSAVLAAHHVGAKRVLVVCPTNVISGWESTVGSCFPGDAVHRRTLNPPVPVDNRVEWCVINYELLVARSEECESFIDLWSPDMLVIDEVHLAKTDKEDPKSASQRRQVLSAVRNRLGHNAFVMAMSATPVVNNLAEGASLVGLVTGRVPEVGTTPTIGHALDLHTHLMECGFRATSQVDVALDVTYDDIDVPNDVLDQLQTLQSRTPSAVERVITSLFVDSTVQRALMAKARGKGIVVYTKYKTGVVGPLRDALTSQGLRVAEFSGDVKVSISSLARSADVLIGTSAVGTGTDGLQHWADTMVIYSAPWTAAEYEQVVGRIHRQGTTASKVEVVIPRAVAMLPDGFEWSWTSLRMKRINGKRTLAAAAVDGVVPDHLLPTPERATRAAIELLERLRSGQVTEDRSSPLEGEFPATPEVTEATRRQRDIVSYGAFSSMNATWNTTRSTKMHQRLRDNPGEWHEYHRLYREARATWETVPAKVIAERIASRRRPWRVADLGCGEMLLTDALKDTAHEVVGYDHVAFDERVTAADIAWVPAADGEFDVAVLSLALMGANRDDYIAEAHRILDESGTLYIAETTSHFKDDARLTQALLQRGFQVNRIERGQFVIVTATRIERPSLPPTVTMW